MINFGKNESGAYRACPETSICEERSGDYSTVWTAGNTVDRSLTKTVRQAWLKLTTQGAFVTITDSLEAEFPG